MRDDYIYAARQVITDPYILVNVVSRRVKQLRRGSRPLVESLEKLSVEDVALREVAEGRISYEIDVVAAKPTPTRATLRRSATAAPIPPRVVAAESAVDAPA
jgi:DNA-directed RNA polymerase subunit omega